MNNILAYRNFRATVSSNNAAMPARRVRSITQLVIGLGLSYPLSDEQLEMHRQANRVKLTPGYRPGNGFTYLHIPHGRRYRRQLARQNAEAERNLAEAEKRRIAMTPIEAIEAVHESDRAEAANQTLARENAGLPTKRTRKPAATKKAAPTIKVKKPAAKKSDVKNGKKTSAKKAK